MAFHVATWYSMSPHGIRCSYMVFDVATWYSIDPMTRYLLFFEGFVYLLLLLFMHFIINFFFFQGQSSRRARTPSWIVFDAAAPAREAPHPQKPMTKVQLIP